MRRRRLVLICLAFALIASACSSASTVRDAGVVVTEGGDSSLLLPVSPPAPSPTPRRVIIVVQDDQSGAVAMMSTGKFVDQDYYDSGYRYAMDPSKYSGKISSFFPLSVQYWEPHIAAWASEKNLSPNLIATLLTVTSCGEKGSRDASATDVKGLFQVKDSQFTPLQDPYDPGTNADAALRVFSDLLLRAGNDVGLAAAAYKDPSVLDKDRSLWDQLASDTSHFISCIYADAEAGLSESPVFNEWNAVNGTKCTNALASLGGENEIQVVFTDRQQPLGPVPGQAQATCGNGLPSMIWPVDSRYVSTPYGGSPEYGAGWHFAVDIGMGASPSKSVKSPVNGVVIEIVSNTRDVGTKIKIRPNNGPNGEDYSDVLIEFWHLAAESVAVQQGQEVAEDSYLAEVGTQKTNQSAPSYGGSAWTGPHIHWVFTKGGQTYDPLLCAR